MSLSKRNEKLCCFEVAVAVGTKNFGLSCDDDWVKDEQRLRIRGVIG